MPLLGGITSFLDKYILGYALGTAAGPALRPFITDLENEAWTLNPVRPPAAVTLAVGVAQGQVNEAKARAWAKETGFGDDQFTALIDIANVGTGAAYAFELWRRGVVDEAGFRRDVKRLGLEQEWIDDLVKLHDVLLSPSDLANARQQEFIDDARMHTEGGEQGYTAERMDLLFKLAGLPPGVETGLAMLRRSIIDRARFAHLVATGHTKTEWTNELLQLQEQVLGASTYAGLHLRGWIDEAAMVSGGKLTGHTQAQMDLLYKEHGRPATAHQVFIGLRRGGVYDGPLTGIPQPFIDAIRQSNIRPEWTNILWAGRFTYPSAFVLRALTQGGDLSQAETEQILLYEGWEPTLAATVSTKWAGGTAAVSDSHVSKAETQLWSTLHASYKAEEIDAATTQQAMSTLGVATTAQPQVLALWDAERALIRAQLTPTQIRKALNNGITNPATGAAWTVADATAALLARGYDQADATVFLQE